MQQLLADPETLLFKKGRTINLGILKKQITRRVIKIKNMLGCQQLKKNIAFSYGCQTQNIQPNGQTYEGIKQSSVLSLQKSTVNLPVQSSYRPLKYAGRCSLPVPKKSGKKFDQNEVGKSTRIRVSQYLQTAKAKDIVTNIQENASQVKVEQDSVGEDNQSSNNDFDIFNPFKHNKKKSQLYIEKYDYNKLSQVALCRSPDQKFNEVQLDSDNYDLHQMKSNFLAAKGMSLKKNRFTERTALEQQKRYSITEETIQKMNIGISKLIVKKRREGQDNKLRQNIFKKIDEKYGEYFDNI